MGATYAESRAVVARYSSMKSMEGITVAKFGVLREKKSVASLRICVEMVQTAYL
jgi:hypothetical protein